MKMIMLIAMRELTENVKTKGFWIGILLMPVIMVGMVFIATKLESSAPIRHYVLLDQSEQYTQTISNAIEVDHQRRVLLAYVEYMRKNLKEFEIDFDRPAASTSQLDVLMSDDGEAALNQWLNSGGLEYALAVAKPQLKPESPDFNSPSQRFVRVPVPDGIDVNAEQGVLVEQLKGYLTGTSKIMFEGEAVSLFAAILIPQNVDAAIVRVTGITDLSANLSTNIGANLGAQLGENPGIQYWAANLTDTDLSDTVERSVNQIIREKEFARRGVDPQIVQEVQRTRLPMRKLDPSKAAGEEEVSLGDTIEQWLPVGFVYIMFFSLLMSAQLLLNNTIEEKSNRIIEVLLASVTPSELMMGKLVGIGLSCFTIIGSWLLSFMLLIYFFQSAEIEIITQLLEVLLGTGLIPFFLFYFVSGYVLYAGIILAIGSVCNTLKEAQNLMTPVMLFLVVPIITMRFIAEDPNGTLARAMSWFPPFTPFAMMNRAAAQPPLIDVIGTTILLLVSIVVVLWLTGKIFRHGILRTGQPPKLLELYQMLRSKS